MLFPVCGAYAGDIGQFVGVAAQRCKAEAKPSGGAGGISPRNIEEHRRATA
jgi:hypothetical protein